MGVASGLDASQGVEALGVNSILRDTKPSPSTNHRKVYKVLFITRSSKSLYVHMKETVDLNVKFSDTI